MQPTTNPNQFQYPNMQSAIPSHSVPFPPMNQNTGANMPQSSDPQISFGHQNVFQDMGAMNMNTLAGSPFAQIGLDFGKQYIGRGTSIFNSQYAKNFSMLKYYFNVNNSYVINKIKLLLFPLSHKYWKRRIHRQGEAEVYLPPRDDINAPDLYIPLMAFVTYVLMIGFLMGTAYKFTPDVLGLTATRGFAVLIFEVLAIKFGFYLLNALTVPILDVISYCAYKYVGVVVTIIIGLSFGSYAYYGATVVTSLFMAIFMVKTLKLVFPESQGYGGSGSSPKRNYFLLAVAILQLVLGYYLSYGTYSQSV